MHICWIYIYIYIYIYDLSKHLVDSILKRVWPLFCTQLNGFKYCYITVNLTCHLFAHIVCFIWHIDRTLSHVTTLGQSGHGSNGNEGVLHIPQIFKIGALPSDGLISYIQETRWRGVLPLGKDEVGVIYSPLRWLGFFWCWLWKNIITTDVQMCWDFFHTPSRYFRFYSEFYIAFSYKLLWVLISSLINTWQVILD